MTTPQIGQTYIDVRTGGRYTVTAIVSRRFVDLVPKGVTLAQIADGGPSPTRVHDTHLHESDYQPNGLPLRHGYRLQTWED